MKIKEVPVFLFTGFLEAGKTEFLQESLEDPEFNSGEKSLIILCEEGEIEFDLDKFPKNSVTVEVIENEEDLSQELFLELVEKHKAERVLVEYNGMWMLDNLYRSMPQGWLIYQEIFFVNANNFLIYNQNMRQLVFDKLKSAEMVIFNRCIKGFDKMEFHQIVRAANRNTQIIYEYGKDDVEIDTIPDPLPYDLDAEIVEIKDDMYAEFYRDLNEEEEKYDGKTLVYRARVVLGGGLRENELILGRHIMTCCADDIQFGGLVGVYENAEKELENGSWAKVKVTVKLEENPMYGEVGPVLYVKEIEKAAPAIPEVAQF